jgi:hypothetical protein
MENKKLILAIAKIIIIAHLAGIVAYIYNQI